MSGVHESRPTWADVSIPTFLRNVRTITSLLPETARLVAVLKADGYGHGALPLARACEDKVAMIATALLEEALVLRRGGIQAPILVLGPLTAPQIRIALDEKLAIGVIGPEELAFV
ncbi:MAG: alanine racemase, partial [Acidobacteria bacterium]|nr:alanine racemase [Acidobacteriota bacterium]